ncbi:QueT transporter family protein [Candidatus Bathyarchaeota archaeon]|nr:QueT transporter family protein [Candidatus Bathyarchaeota archaeon]
MKSAKDVGLMAVFAALYASLVYAFAPISFYALQFRVAGAIRPMIARKWFLSLGYALGVAVGNIFSPYAGPYELVFMPIMSLIAGVLGFVVAKKFKKSYFVAGAVIATVIAISVSWMLSQFGSPMLATLPYLMISEQIICILGAFTLKFIDTRFRWWE